MSSNFILFWLFLELSVLSLVPCFFSGTGSVSLSSLFSYLIVSSISSFFIIGGFVGEGLNLFIVLGLCIKFGLFPFYGWVYSVIENSSWYVIWGLSTFLKVSFLMFPFFLSSGSSLLVYGMSFFSLILLSFLFWFYSYSWKHCWCHMMLSSSVVLISLSLSLDVESLLKLFVIYFLWASFVIYYLAGISFSEALFSEGNYYFFLSLLVTYPLSLAIFYKFLLGFCVFSCGFYIFLGWVVYSVSEQLYLVKFFVGLNSFQSRFGSWSLV